MRIRRSTGAVHSAVILTVLVLVAPVAAEQVVFARQPALSPDGQSLAFSWAGDIWTVSATGGTARRLTINAAFESHPVWSRDGGLLAFASDRHGTQNVFVMTSDGNDIRRLTFSDNAEIPSDFSPDGNYIYFYARKTGELNWNPRMYRVPTAGGQSWLISEASGSFPKMSPDGKTIVFTRGVSKWWRTGYRGSANWDLWLFEPGTNEFRQVTDFNGTDMYPVWDVRGTGLYYISDREDTHNVWFKTLRGLQPQKITNVSGERVRDFTVSANGRRLVYAQWDKIFTMTLPGGKPQEVIITAGADSARNETELQTLTDGASEVEVAPTGEEVALVAYGEIYVIKTEADKPTRQVTNSPARDWQVSWSPDGDALYFISDRGGQEDVYRATSGDEPAVALSDSLRFMIERVTDTIETESGPQISPDGAKLSFVRGRGDVYIRDLESGAETLLFAGWNSPQIRWSADSKWIAYSVEDEEYNSDVWIVPADGSTAAVNISQHPDYDGNPQWSANGQILAFASRRAGMDTDLYMVFLSKELSEKSTVDLDEYFKQAAKKVGKLKPPKHVRASGEIVLGLPVAAETQPALEQTPATDEQAAEPKPEEASIEQRLRVLLKEFLESPAKDEKKEAEQAEPEQPEPTYKYDLDSAYKRLRRVTRLPVDQTSFALAPAGDLLVFNSSHEGSSRLFSVKWNGRDCKRIMSANAGALQWTLSGKRLFYNKSGKPGSCSASGGDVKTHDFRAKLAIAWSEQARQKFDDAARALGRQFYHPTLKGLDWKALSEKHRELALRTHTYEEFNTIFNLLQGRLNGSHLGISGPDHRSVERIGYLGCDFDPEFVGPGLRVSWITPNSPADRDESRLRVGDVLLMVNGQPVGPDAALDRSLIDTVGEQIIIEYLPSPDRLIASASPAESNVEEDTLPDDRNETAAREAEKLPEPSETIIRPVSYGAFARLRYDEWVERNRQYVAERSGGRLAYLHIAGMGESQFHDFERDLYAAAHGRDGLIIDVRNNGGGWTADWVMDVLNVQRHAYTIGRGGKPGYPQGRLIFYAWTKPATMMCNECSYSNAEIVSHAFKNLGRGPLVGTTTFGAVISTGAYRLIDGTTVRMPFRGWYTLPDRVDMENHGAIPDVETTLTPAAEARGLRPQLDAAIKATLAQIDGIAPTSGVVEPKQDVEEVPAP